MPETPMIARSQWRPTDLSAYMSPVKDQDGIGACNAFDTCYVVEGCRATQGLPRVTLSPGYLYGNINGGVDEGSLLEDAMTWMMERGTCLASTVEELDWHSQPAAAVAEARNYRVLEAYVCPTFDHMASAPPVRLPRECRRVVVCERHARLRRLAARARRGQSGGHAICRCSLVERSGRWGLGGPNSWGESWGVRGYFTMPESRFDGPIGGWWAVREVVDEGGVVP